MASTKHILLTYCIFTFLVHVNMQQRLDPQMQLIADPIADAFKDNWAKPEYHPYHITPELDKELDKIEEEVKEKWMHKIEARQKELKDQGEFEDLIARDAGYDPIDFQPYIDEATEEKIKEVYKEVNDKYDMQDELKKKLKEFDDRVEAELDRQRQERQAEYEKQKAEEEAELERQRAIQEMEDAMNVEKEVEEEMRREKEAEEEAKRLAEEEEAKRLAEEEEEAKRKEEQEAEDKEELINYGLEGQYIPDDDSPYAYQGRYQRQFNPYDLYYNEEDPDDPYNWRGGYGDPYFKGSYDEPNPYANSYFADV